MDLVIRCKDCSTELSFTNIKRLCDLDHSKIGMYCNECFPAAEQKIKDKRFVEEYKGNSIYCKDGKYAPYWQSHYYFNTIEGARLRIDNKHMVVIDPEVMRFIGL